VTRPVDRLRTVPLFAEMTVTDLDRICDSVTEVNLRRGDALFAEGDAGDHAYVIVDGELEVIKASDRRETLLAVRGAGEVIGEMALLQEAPRMASVRARSDAELLCIPKKALDELLDTSPSAAKAMFSTLLDRWEETNERLRHNERMAQLGTLTAGVAHELNNPAAAVKRAAEQLNEALAEYETLVSAAPPEVANLRDLGVAPAAGGATLDPMERSDLEDSIESWLDLRDVPDGWRLAPGLVDAGYDIEKLDELESKVDADVRSAIEVAVAAATVEGLVTTIGSGATRLSTIVGALKSYTYLDQAPVQDVDVVQGIEDTVLLLAHKLDGVTLRREFAPDLPAITAFGSELNQVWTNLIDNAAYAASEVEEPVVTLRVVRDGDELVVDVEDNGPGIPEDAKQQIFDAFYTTKPPGQGTGLGLQITHRIVVLDHRGALEVESEPGRTVFRVRLPITQEVDEDVDEDVDEEENP
jgi:signal transduction histidine kinase